MKQNGLHFTLAEWMVVLIILVSILLGMVFTISDAIHNTSPTKNTVIEITHDDASDQRSAGK